MQIVSPFPVEAYPDLYGWLLQFPDANFDDTVCEAARTWVWIQYEMQERERRGELTWLVSNDEGKPAGIICYAPITPRLGILHGICFGRGLMPPDQKREAARAVLKGIFDAGAEKVCALYFATNWLIGTFLADVGFGGQFQAPTGLMCEGYLPRHTTQRGQPVDMIQVALFKVDAADFTELNRAGATNAVDPPTN